MKPWIHAESSAKKFGGTPEEYFEIHDFMDCSKGAFPTNAHRALTHNAWFIKAVLERVKFSNSCEPVGNSFPYIVLTNGKKVSVRDVGEQHILEDFGNRFLPSAQDYLQYMEYQPWMGNDRGSLPPSFQNTIPKTQEKVDIVFKPRPKMPDRVYDGNIAGDGRKMILDGGRRMMERMKEEAADDTKAFPNFCSEIEMPGGAQQCVTFTHFNGEPLEEGGEKRAVSLSFDSAIPTLNYFVDGSSVPHIMAEVNKSILKD